MGYILNFQNNFNNMKNEIGRKITSLTLMTIMFAGGMTLAVPGFLPMAEILPEAYADRGTTQGMLTVSSTEVQGAQVVALTVSDPAYSATNTVVAPITMDLNSSTIQLTQVSDGTWMAFFADKTAAAAADAITDTSLEFGTVCAATLSVTEGFKESTETVYVETDSCTNPNGGSASAFNVLTDVPEMTFPDGDVSGMLYGQVGHDIYDAASEKNDNSWPFILMQPTLLHMVTTQS